MSLVSDIGFFKINGRFPTKSNVIGTTAVMTNTILFVFVIRYARKTPKRAIRTTEVVMVKKGWVRLERKGMPFWG